MTVQRGFKTELDLNAVQRVQCAQHAGAARYAYNWGLARKRDAYRAGKEVPTAIDLHRELNALKRTKLGWMYHVSKCAPQEALRDLDRAYRHFFRRVKQKKAERQTVKQDFPSLSPRSAGWGVSA
jgi:putative transposase